MSSRTKYLLSLVLLMLVLFSQTGCTDSNEELSSVLVTQKSSATAGTPTGVEVIRQSTAEVVSFGPDGFALDDLEVITPENADRMQELAVIGPGQFMEEITVSPDGEYVAVALTNGVLFFDPDSGELVNFYSTSSEVIDMTVSPDGRRLAAITLMESDEHYPTSAPEPDAFVTHPVLTIWDWTTDEKVLVQQMQGRGCGEYYVNDMVFSPDGSLLAFRDKYGLVGFTETDNLCVVSAEDGSLLQAIPVETAWSSYGQMIVFTEDGQSLILAVNQRLGEDQYLRGISKYDLVSGEGVQSIEVEGDLDIRDLALSPDGLWVAVSTNEGVQIHTLADGVLMSTIQNEGRDDAHVVFSPDGQTLAYSLANGVIGLAALSDGNPLWENPPLTTVYMPSLLESFVYDTRLAFSSEGDQLFVYPLGAGRWSVDSIQILATADGHEMRRFNETNPYISKTLSPDGSRVLFGGYQDGEVQLWSVPGNQLIWSTHEHSAMVVDMAFSPEGEQVATASLDGSVRLWQANDGAMERTLAEDLGPTWHVAYAPGGGQLASLSGNGTLRLWDLGTGDLAKEIPTGVMGPWQNDIVFASGSEGLFITSGCQDFQCQGDLNNGGLYWVDLATGEVELLVDSCVPYFTLSADQSQAGLYAFRSAQSVDMQTLQAIHSYSSPLAEQGLVAGAGISPDSSLFVAGNGFGLHVWDNASGQLIGIIEGTLPQGNVVFSSDQRLVSVSSKYGPFSVWGVPTE